MDSVPGSTEMDETPTPESEDDDPRIEDDEWATGDTHLIRLAARTDGWAGIGPNEDPDEENPPLRLRAGVTYEVIWENRDGERHQLVIADADGEEVASTGSTGEFAATRSMEFTAHNELEEYYCRFHPDLMRGDIRVGAEEW